MFRKNKPLPSEAALALEDLNRFAKERPSLSEALEFLRDILPFLFTHESDQTLAVDRESAFNGLRNGTALLHDSLDHLEFPSLDRRWKAICRKAKKRQTNESTASLQSLAKADPAEVRQWARLALRRDLNAIQGRAGALNMDADQVMVVLRLALLPSMSRMRNLLFAELETPSSEFSWLSGNCFVCGQAPLLAEHRGLEQFRFLRCGWCAADWKFSRLSCPYCGAGDHHDLGYFHVEGEEERFRVAVCARCRGYWKVISTLTALTAPQLLVYDAATLHLDLAAAERGYLSQVKEAPSN